MQTLKVLKILEQSGEELLAKAMKQPENELIHDIGNLVASIKAARRMQERELLEEHEKTDQKPQIEVRLGGTASDARSVPETVPAN